MSTPVSAPRPAPPLPTAVAEARRTDLAVRDLTDPGQGPHAVQLVLDEAVTALRSAWPCTVRTVRSHPIVTVDDNYDRLRYSPDDVTRDARYTRYVSRRLLLRTHTTALVPAALTAVGAAPLDDELLVCPGVVYRRDAIDRLHTGTPHQVDLWRIGSTRLDERDLEAMIAIVVEGVLPDRPWRTEPRVHPYTVHGRQIDVRDGDRWIEVGECGIAHPEILKAAGIDPVTCGGLAMGLGLDRLVMLRKGIDDIRLLRSTDGRVAEQLLDLSPYRPVSHHPAVVRDLSIAVDATDAAEDLGDRVRGALGEDADAVESIEVLGETPVSALPDAARDRLGIGVDQKNLLVRVVLRHLDRTLTSTEANELRDRVYGALHRGRRHQWAARDPVHRDGE